MSAARSGVRAIVTLLLLAGCEALPADSGSVPPAPVPRAVAPAASAEVRAVLIAGDGSIPVFDDAVAGMVAWLRGRGVPERDIVRLSASPAVAGREGVQPATLRNVVDAIGRMAPPPGGRCFVFATSHGGYGSGLYLAASRAFLPPTALDWALQRGCGAAPAVVVVSSCYAGIYTHPPVAGADRIVLTAARADRSSFGCAAGREYTVYDSCLLQALPRAQTWHAVSERVRLCIAAEEHRQGYGPPSEPQAYFGRAVADATLP